MEDFLEAFAFALLIAGQFSGVIAAYGMPDHATPQQDIVTLDRRLGIERNVSSTFIQ
jgi:hypothetical protein